MKKLILFVAIGILVLSLVTVAYAAKVIPPSSTTENGNVINDNPGTTTTQGSPDPTNLPGWKENAQKNEPIPDLPRIAVVIKGDWNEEDITYLSSVIETELIKAGEGKFTIVPYQQYLLWLNAVQDYTHQSGRYDPRSLPSQSKYLAPTHILGITVTYEWKESGLGVGIKGKGNFGTRKSALVTTIRGQIFDAEKAIAVGAIDAKGEAGTRIIDAGNQSIALSQESLKATGDESTQKAAQQSAKQLKNIL
jgi:hypothetical protein